MKNELKRKILGFIGPDDLEILEMSDTFGCSEAEIRQAYNEIKKNIE